MAEFGPGELQMALLHAVNNQPGIATATLSQALGLSPKRVSNAASCLVARCYLQRRRPGIYEITPHGADFLASGESITSGPRDRDETILQRPASHGFRDRLWTSMRLRRSFTIHDVVCDAENGEKDAVNVASRYIRILKSVDYVMDLPGKVPGTRPGSGGFKRFRLVKNTGPRAPMYRAKLGLVHDFNTGEDWPCSPR